MRKQTTETASESRPGWNTLEHCPRDRMQDLVQHVLEEELAEFRRRAKSAESWINSATGSRGHPRRWQKLELTSWPSPPSPALTVSRCGRTIPRSD